MGMITPDSKRAMYTDLLITELEARQSAHLVTRRAGMYLESGLAMSQVLQALKISRATWYRRVEALEAWVAELEAVPNRLYVKNTQPEDQDDDDQVDDEPCQVHEVIGCRHCAGELEALGL